MSTFKIATVQSAPVFMDREATVDKICELIAEAAQDDDVRLVVFPEAFIPTYPDWVGVSLPESTRCLPTCTGSCSSSR